MTIKIEYTLKDGFEEVDAEIDGIFSDAGFNFVASGSDGKTRDLVYEKDTKNE